MQDTQRRNNEKSKERRPPSIPTFAKDDLTQRRHSLDTDP